MVTQKPEPRTEPGIRTTRIFHSSLWVGEFITEQATVLLI